MSVGLLLVCCWMWLAVWSCWRDVQTGLLAEYPKWCSAVENCVLNVQCVTCFALLCCQHAVTAPLVCVYTWLAAAHTMCFALVPSACPYSTRQCRTD